MGKIVVSEQMLLQGGVHDPSGREETSRRGPVNEMSQRDRDMVDELGLLAGLPNLIFDAVAA